MPENNYLMDAEVAEGLHRLFGLKIDEQTLIRPIASIIRNVYGISMDQLAPGWCDPRPGVRRGTCGPATRLIDGMRLEFSRHNMCIEMDYSDLTRPTRMRANVILNALLFCKAKRGLDGVASVEERDYLEQIVRRLPNLRLSKSEMDAQDRDARNQLVGEDFPHLECSEEMLKFHYLTEAEVVDGIDRLIGLKIPEEDLMRPVWSVIDNVYKKFMDQLETDWSGFVLFGILLVPERLKSFMFIKLTFSHYNMEFEYDEGDKFRPTRRRTKVFLNALLFCKATRELQGLVSGEKREYMEQLVRRLSHFTLSEEERAAQVHNVRRYFMTTPFDYPDSA